MESSPLLPLHTTAGARLASDGRRWGPLTFGDVPGEYRAGMESAALFDETERGRIEIRGEEACAFLHRILASDVRSLAEGRGQRSLLLSAKGKVLFDFDLFRVADGASLSLPAGTATRLLAALDTYLFAEKVSLADTSAEHAPLALCGPTARDLVSRATGLEVPADDHSWNRGRSGNLELFVARVPVAGSSGCLVDAGAEGASELWTRLKEAGAKPAGIVARDILRIEAGRALYGEDVDESVYPQEARLQDAFSLTKGCFIGQEVVAKIDTYGGLNKRLVGLKISHDDPVPRGTRLLLDEGGERRDLGVVTSWAYSFVLDTGLALAFVKRKHQEPGTVFHLGDGDATAEIVPLPVRSGALPISGGSE